MPKRLPADGKRRVSTGRPTPLHPSGVARGEKLHRLFAACRTCGGQNSGTDMLLSAHHFVGPPGAAQRSAAQEGCAGPAGEPARLVVVCLSSGARRQSQDANRLRVRGTSRP